ncbi:MAG: nucleoside-diphosphate kinase [Chloroflexota bacterium]
MAAERTLVLLKPDAVQRGLTGKVIDRLESAGLKIAGMKLLQVNDDLASRHYAEHEDKPFYKGLVNFITSGPVVAMCLEGPGAIALTRKLMGSTNPADAAPGTIRGDFALDIGRNIIHGSADEGDARREVSLFFSEGELMDYARDTDPWIVE